MGHFGEKIVSFFNDATVKLEELQLQSALGKAELSDKLEEIKKEAKEKIHEIKSKIVSFGEDKKEDLNHLKAKVEHLEVQAALAKAETAEEIEEQKKSLSSAMHDVKTMLSKD